MHKSPQSSISDSQTQLLHQNKKQEIPVNYKKFREEGQKLSNLQERKEHYNKEARKSLKEKGIESPAEQELFAEENVLKLADSHSGKFAGTDSVRKEVGPAKPWPEKYSFTSEDLKNLVGMDLAVSSLVVPIPIGSRKIEKDGKTIDENIYEDPTDINTLLNSHPMSPQFRDHTIGSWMLERRLDDYIKFWFTSDGLPVTGYNIIDISERLHFLVKGFVYSHKIIEDSFSPGAVSVIGPDAKYKVLNVSNLEAGIVELADSFLMVDRRQIDDFIHDNNEEFGTSSLVELDKLIDEYKSIKMSSKDKKSKLAQFRLAHGKLSNFLDVMQNISSVREDIKSFKSMLPARIINALKNKISVDVSVGDQKRGVVHLKNRILQIQGISINCIPPFQYQDLDAIQPHQNLGEAQSFNPSESSLGFSLLDPEEYEHPKEIIDFLLFVFSNDTKAVTWFLEFIARSLFGQPPILALWFIGPPSTGKTTLMKLMRLVFGKKMVTPSTNPIWQSPGAPADLTEKTVFKNKLLCNIAEPDSKSKFRQSEFKNLVESDSYTGRWLFKGQIEYSNFCSLLIDSNTVPSMSEITGGTRRRLLFIDCSNHLGNTKEGRVDGLADQLFQKEGDRFGNFLLLIYKHLLETHGSAEKTSTFIRTSVPISITRFTMATFGENQGTISHWFNENVILIHGPEGQEAKTPGFLYPKFKLWCESNGYTRVPSIKSFQKDLRKLITDSDQGEVMICGKPRYATWYCDGKTENSINDRTRGYSGILVTEPGFTTPYDPSA